MKTIFNNGKNEEEIEVVELDKLRKLAETGNKTIWVEGIISKIEDATTKSGKPYIKGLFSAGQNKVNFKIWDKSSDDLFSFAPFVKDKGIVVRAELQSYEGEPQLIIASQNIFPSKKNYSDFVEKSVISGADAGTVITTFLAEAASAGYSCCGVANKLINGFYKEGKMKDMGCNPISVLPYSLENHSERGGLFQHVFNCFLRAKPENMPQKVIMKDGKKSYTSAINVYAVRAAIAAYHIFMINFFEIDKSGMVTSFDDKELLLSGNTGVFKSLAWAESDLPKEVKESSEYRNFVHIVYALNNLVSPATPEAVMACEVVKAELSLDKKVRDGKLLFEKDI